MSSPADNPTPPSTSPSADPTDLPADPAATPSDLETTPTAPSGPIVARAGTYFRNARYLMVALVIGFGISFIYDWQVRYPRHNREYEAAPENKKSEHTFHGPLDMAFQKWLGLTLPPLGLALLGYWLYKSRGTVRLENGTLYMPGHPPFALDDITKLEKRLWDRKGIAYIEYQTPAGQQGRATLDDFVYQRKPIDQIYDAIVANLKERSTQD